MLLYIGKVILLFSVSIVVIRLLGKAALAQLTPHDLTAIIFLASMAVNPILDESVGRVVIGIIIIVLLHILFSKLALFRWLNRLIIGEPTILIKHGKIIKSNLSKSHYSLMELLATLRAGGYPNVQDVEYAILESTGDISVIPKSDKVTLTPRHLGIETEYQGLPLSLVVEGRIMAKNLKLLGKNEEWLEKKLAEQGFSTKDRIFYAAVMDRDERLIIDTGKQ
jgi:uncharacterized membrane protein YcaP (DUF421 family)